jgi:hypothetical protein
MATNLLRNGGFEADWGEERSHQVLVFRQPGRAGSAEVRDNIFTPPGWTTWFRHEPGTWDQPEVRDAWISGDSSRVHSGQKGVLLFTFFRRHDAGFLQQVDVVPGSRLRLTAWAHAWSNHGDPALPGRFPHSDDPRWSEGEHVGYEHFFALEGTDELDDGDRNFTFTVGIDPTGGIDPYADTVVWAQGAHIYNAHRPVPSVEAVAQTEKVTVLLRSRTLWTFKHNDAYWDDARLEALSVPVETRIVCDPSGPQVGQQVGVTVTSTGSPENVGLDVTDPSGEPLSVSEVPGEPRPGGRVWRWIFVPGLEGVHHVVFTADRGARRLAETTVDVQPRPVEPWGLPRSQYRRVYVLLPPGAGRDWAEAVLGSTAWERERWTVGGSADDAGIGALEDKRVVAVNPSGWPDDLEAFFRRYYPRVQYTEVVASTPVELRRRLNELNL